MRHMEMAHPECPPRDNITVHLTSSESLDYLSKNAVLASQIKQDNENAPLDTGSFDEIDETFTEVIPTSPIVEELKTWKIEDISDEPALEITESDELQPSDQSHVEV